MIEEDGVLPEKKWHGHPICGQRSCAAALKSPQAGRKMLDALVQASPGQPLPSSALSMTQHHPRPVAKGPQDLDQMKHIPRG
eukprot:CAMPEP_0181456566 /NCGR_PEP_ID=MMETSP1110-20121109/31338_2 /TAXON_ID=174948 /ORGANISM="Symbiodinium sp., Strain CCMP421" /LENGTH=81 /DNA_ID=CAMNT_0023580983 /DNA_START=698 /DNA_END=943 /DNA_ORIENTATION=-